VLLKVGAYGGHCAVQVVQNPSRGDPQGTDASLGHPGVAHHVALGLITDLVSVAVDLDREPGRCAEEIEHVGAHRMLSAKSQAVELSAPQSRP
jgi:hypothetical protein